jgi:diguanylate cyclase (GGDEF)-like protein
MLMTRGVWIAMRGGQHDFFDYSPVHLMGFLGFDVLIAGVPLGYFWMTSARLYANQELLARTDSLTNLPNRRALEEFALREMERSRRNERPLAILVIDLDHFKRINDQYGHDAGDAALGAVAKALAAVLRMQDVLARLGGEEFVVLLPDTDKQSAMMIAQRLRETIGSLRINCGHGFLSVTASLGIALFRNDDTLETALRRADRALYTAKLAGRNNVMQESCFQQLPAIEVNDAYHRPFDASH